MKGYQPHKVELNATSNTMPFLELGIAQDKCNCENCMRMEGGEKEKCLKK